MIGGDADALVASAWAQHPFPMENISALSGGATDNQGGPPPELTLTNQEIAARIGTVREVVGRTLAELEREGLIRVESDKVRASGETGPITIPVPARADALPARQRGPPASI